MEAIKDGATKRINRSRRETGTLWQPRFFDPALRSVEEYISSNRRNMRQS
jgi:hypothetical protein